MLKESLYWILVGLAIGFALYLADKYIFSQFMFHEEKIIFINTYALWFFCFCHLLVNLTIIDY